MSLLVASATKPFTRRLAFSASMAKSTDSAVAPYLDSEVATNSGCSTCARSTHTPQAKDVCARPLSLPTSSDAPAPCSSWSDADPRKPRSSWRVSPRVPAATSASAAWMDSGEMMKLLPLPAAARTPTSLARRSWLDASPPASLPTIDAEWPPGGAVASMGPARACVDSACFCA
jgi:hypothetical protein